VALSVTKGVASLRSEHPAECQTFCAPNRVAGVFTKEPAAEAPQSVTEEAVQALEDIFQQQVATLSVAPHSDAWSVLSTRRGSTVSGNHVVVHFTDRAIFADEITSYGDDVVVESPPELRALVTANLTALVAHHGG